MPWQVCQALKLWKWIRKKFNLCKLPQDMKDKIITSSKFLYSVTKKLISHVMLLHFHSLLFFTPALPKAGFSFKLVVIPGKQKYILHSEYVTEILLEAMVVQYWTFYKTTHSFSSTRIMLDTAYCFRCIWQVTHDVSETVSTFILILLIALGDILLFLF